MARRRERKRVQATEQRQREMIRALRRALGEQQETKSPSRLRAWVWRCRSGLACVGAGLGVWLLAVVVDAAGVPWTTVALLGGVAVALAGWATRNVPERDRVWIVLPAVFAVAYLVTGAVTGA